LVYTCVYALTHKHTRTASMCVCAYEVCMCIFSPIIVYKAVALPLDKVLDLAALSSIFSKTMLTFCVSVSVKFLGGLFCLSESLPPPIFEVFGESTLCPSFHFFVRFLSRFPFCCLVRDHWTACSYLTRKCARPQHPMDSEGTRQTPQHPPFMM